MDDDETGLTQPQISPRPGASWVPTPLSASRPAPRRKRFGLARAAPTTSASEPSMRRRREMPVPAGLPGAEKLTVSRKTNTKEIIGPLGVRKIMEAVKNAGYYVPTVCIGGINHGNIQRVLTESGMIISGSHGAAVVSAIVADANPKLAAQRLKNLIQCVPVRQLLMAPEFRKGKSLALEIWEVARDILHQKPVSHNMTNLVLSPPPSTLHREAALTTNNRWSRTLPPTSPSASAHPRSWRTTAKKLLILRSSAAPWSSTWAPSRQKASPTTSRPSKPTTRQTALSSLILSGASPRHLAL